MDEEQVSSGIFDFSKGNRFNAKGHDWMVFDNYLSLSFSYMTFVIKDMIERSDPSIANNEFDMEPYNYLFNRRTSFIDSKFVTTDSDELVSVLDEFEKVGVVALGILNYTRPINKKEIEEQRQREAEEIAKKAEKENAGAKSGLAQAASFLNPLDLTEKMANLAKT